MRGVGSKGFYLFLCILLIDFPFNSWRGRGAGDTDCQRLAHRAHAGFFLYGMGVNPTPVRKTDIGATRRIGHVHAEGEKLTCTNRLFVVNSMQERLVLAMMYPFLQIDGDTEIVHSDTLPNGEVKVYVEKPDAKDGFHHASCFLPAYRWEDVEGFSAEEIDRYQEVIESTAHLIMEFAQTGGFENAAGL